MEACRYRIFVSVDNPRLEGLDPQIITVTACLEDLEMSGILTAAGEMPEILLKVMEVLGEILLWKSGHKLFIVDCIFASIWVFSSIQLVLCVNYSMLSLSHILIIERVTYAYDNVLCKLTFHHHQ